MPQSRPRREGAPSPSRAHSNAPSSRSLSHGRDRERDRRERGRRVERQRDRGGHRELAERRYRGHRSSSQQAPAQSGATAAAVPEGARRGGGGGERRGTATTTTTRGGGGEGEHGRAQGGCRGSERGWRRRHDRSSSSSSSSWDESRRRRRRSRSRSRDRAEAQLQRLQSSARHHPQDAAGAVGGGSFQGVNRFATSQRPQHAFAAAPAFRDEVIGGMHRPALLAFLHGCSDQQSDVPPTDQAKLRAVVRDMNRAGYVSPVLSKRFEFGGKVRMLKNTPRTPQLLATEMMQSLNDDCNTYRMPTFAHVPKNAGTFVTHNYVVRNLGHTKGLPQADLMVCRNPYDRIVSSYTYFRMQRNFWHAADGSPAIYGKNPLTSFCMEHSFADFVAAVCIAGTIDDRHMWRQSDYVLGPVKHVVRFESLQTDLDRLVELGVLRHSVSNLPTKAEAKNASTRDKKKGWRDYFAEDDLLFQAVEAFYDKDFSQFGYEKVSKFATRANGANGHQETVGTVQQLLAIAKTAESMAVRGDDGEGVLRLLSAIGIDAGAASSVAASTTHAAEGMEGGVAVPTPGRASRPELLSAAMSRTALAAAEKGRARILHVLIQHCGVDVNTRRVKDDSTLLHLAAYFGHKAACEELVARGASLLLLNKWKEQPHQCARARKHLELADMLGPPSS